MPHRVLVLGNTGMLGHMVEHILAADVRFQVRGVGRSEFDINQTFPPLFQGGGEGGCPDYIVNCIGITARHIDDADPESVARAIRVNAEFPHAFAAAAAQHGVRVIHMSTDGVFSGTSAEPLNEDATPDATDTYGRTKTLGESAASNVLNVRCSIVGPSPVKHEGLWEWIAAQPDGATIDGYTNHAWHGVTTRQFAEFCKRIIAEDRFNALRAGGPVLHLAPNHPISKHDLLCAIRDALGMPLTVRSVAHRQPVHRILAMRPNVAAMFGETPPIVCALRACAAAIIGSDARHFQP